MTDPLPAWTKVAKPRADIADGSFDESAFAADLGLADAGLGRSEYRDAATFFEQTYLTDRLAELLDELIRRVNGDPAAAGVFRMQTEFGGGKTHTLLSVLHLFRSPHDVRATACGGELATRTGIEAFPQAKVVVLDGSTLAPGVPEEVAPGLAPQSLIGHLAARLGGKSAFDAVADQDKRMLGTSTQQLAEILAAHAPCVILLDEVLEYLIKAQAISVGTDSMAATSLTFVKELCTAAAATPRTAVLATLTASSTEAYSEEGVRLFETLQKVVGRQENVVTPVEGDDVFAILRRRLFRETADQKTRDAVIDAYAGYYETLGDRIPLEYREPSYRGRMEQAYPFHPELVDLLANRWGSLSGFQRTRGALRTLGHTVKALWLAHSDSPLIHVGDMQLADAGVRGEVLKVAGDSYKAALNADIIAADSKAPSEDRRRGGESAQYGLARGMATSSFLYSFGPDKVLGASAAQLMLGVARPGLSAGIIEDVRDSLENVLWYGRLEGGRWRFTTEPNLNKVILEREGTIAEDRIAELLRDAIGTMAPGTPSVRTVRRVIDPSDLPDEPRLTLGVVDPSKRIGGPDEPEVIETARHILLERGGGGGRVNKNCALLVLADDRAIAMARATARTLAALEDIVSDTRRLQRFNTEQRDQLAARLKATRERLPQQVVQAFRHLLMLAETKDGTVDVDKIDLGLATATDRIDERIERHLIASDRLLVDTLSPATLLSQRFAIFADTEETVPLEDLRSWFARLLRLPRLGSVEVLRDCIRRGVTDSVFALASGATWNDADSKIILGTHLTPDEIQFQPGTWLVKAAPAREELSRRAPDETGKDHPAPTEAPDLPVGGDEAESNGATATKTRASTVKKLRLEIGAVPAEQARQFVAGVVLPLASQGATVSFKVDLVADAEATGGLPAELIDLTVLEALRQLGVNYSETRE